MTAGGRTMAAMHTTLADLQREALAFRDARAWAPFHRAKDLAMGLTIEAGELLELFLWKRDDEVDAARADPAARVRVGEEMADVLMFLLYLAHERGVDLVDAFHDKLVKNAAKYPVERFRGSATKYDAAPEAPTA